jgi:thymidylate synthase (FAD)
MRIIDQSYEIINLPKNSLELIEAAGRTCYKSEDKIGCTLDECKVPLERRKFKWYIEPDKGMSRKQICTGCPYHSSHKFTKMLIDRGHHAMLEFGDITVRFVTNRGVTHELVRHRLFSFAQESTRYVRYDGQMEFIQPVWVKPAYMNDTYTAANLVHCSPQDPVHVFIAACIKAEMAYLDLLALDWRPEQAREILPNSLKTEIVVKGNIRQFRHMFQLRISKKAHPQIRHLMLPLLAELQSRVPMVFDDIGD